jgi:lipopolysaccharide transport system ATP-binding protein
VSTVIKIENVSKQYRLGNIGTNTLKGDIQRWWYNIRGLPDPTLMIGQENKLSSAPGFQPSSPGHDEYVWALRDINFEVKQGEVLGIIGKNGAGKSTLLKLLSRVTAPTTGSIKVKGRIASLLEVGTGFHPELTGRENIFLNGAILGMTKGEIRGKLDEIVDFAGVSKYIDTPVKRYSSGMYVRLAFAVAAHLEPEILIVDEVLAVGDAEFQKKAIGKMQDVSVKDGRTVLFVSHNMLSIRALCDKGLVLDNGSLSYGGNINEAIDYYLQTTSLVNLQSKNEWDDFTAPGCIDIRLKKVYLIDEDFKNVDYAYVNERIGICVEYSVKREIPFFTHSINIFNSEGSHVFTSHDTNNYTSNEKIKGGVYRTTVWIYKNLFQDGEYFLSFACMRYSPYVVLFHEMNIIKFRILDSMVDSSRNINYSGKFPGIVRPLLDWDTRQNLI